MDQGGNLSVSAHPPQRVRQYDFSAPSNSARASGSFGLPRILTTFAAGVSSKSFLTSFPLTHPKSSSIHGLNDQYGKAYPIGCIADSPSRRAVSHSPSAARVSRAGVAARTSPGDRADFPGQRVDALAGAFPTTANARRFLADARPCLFSDPSNLCPSSSEARQRFPVQGFGISPIEGAADHFSCPEIDHDQLPHLSVLPARSSVRPVSVQ